MQLKVDCTTDISSAFAGVTFCRRVSGVVYVVKNRRLLVSGSRFRTPLASNEEVGYMGVYVCWGVHDLEAGCTSKCMHFPQIVLVTIEVEHRFGYLCC